MMMPELTKCTLSGNFGARLAELARTKITDLSVQGCGLVPDAFSALAQCKNLTRLNLKSTRTTDADVAKLAVLEGLDGLTLSATRVTLEGLRALKSLRKLHRFSWSFTPGKGTEELGEIARLFPQITVFEIFSVAATEADIAAFGTFRELTRLEFNDNKITDDAIRGIGAVKRLQSVRLSYRASITDVGLGYIAAHKGITEVICTEAADITDAGILKLAKMNQLKRLEIANCEKLTPAGFAAFQKARPDVTLAK